MRPRAIIALLVAGGMGVGLSGWVEGLRLGWNGFIIAGRGFALGWLNYTNSVREWEAGWSG